MGTMKLFHAYWKIIKYAVSSSDFIKARISGFYHCRRESQCGTTTFRFRVGKVNDYGWLRMMCNNAYYLGGAFLKQSVWNQTKINP